MPVLLSMSQSTLQTDSNGLASFVPSIGSFTGVLEIQIEVSTGISAVLQDVMESLPQSDGNASSPAIKAPWLGSVPITSAPMTAKPVRWLPP